MTSDPAATGTNDWKPEMLDFIAPMNVLTIAVQQRPKFSYEDPTNGTVWFDDFQLQEIQPGT